MDSKEATSHPASPGSSTSSSLYPDSSQNVVLLDKTVGLNDNSGSHSKGAVSEDENYESGTEEFETALDKPVLDESVGEGNSDASFVDASAKLESSGVTVNDDVEKGERGVEGDESVVGKDSERGVAVDDSKEGSSRGVGDFDGKGEVIDSVENMGVNYDEGVVKSGGGIVDGNAGEVVVEEVETKGEESQDRKSESLSIGHEVSKPEAREVIDTGDVKLTSDGDSVVDTVQVDVAGPGVAVVGEKEGSGVVVNKPEEKDVDDVGMVKAEKPVVDTHEGVTVTPEGVSVVDAIQGDVAGPGAVGAVTNKLEEKEVSEVDVVDPEKSEVVSVGNVASSPEVDSVVDTIQVDKVGPGVAVVGEMDENGGGEVEGVEVPLVSVGGATESGDIVNEEVGAREVGEGDIVESKPLQPEHVVGDEKDEKLDGGGGVDLVNGVQASSTDDKSLDEPAFISEAIENGVATKIQADRGAVHEDEIAASDRDVNQFDVTYTVQTNGDHSGVHEQNDRLVDEVLEGPKLAASAESKAVLQPQEIGVVEDEIDEEVHPEDSMSDGDIDGMIFGSSEAAKKFIEDLERESGGDSHMGADSSVGQSQGIDGQIVTDSEEEGDSDDEGDGNEMFDSAALAALLKAATGADSDGGSITISSQDGRLFSVERPAGLGSSLRSLRPAPRTNRPGLFSSSTPAGGGESEANLTEEEKKKLEKLQQIRVKFLRLVHRLGLSPEESVAAQVLYRLALLGGRQGTHAFSLDAAKRMALELEAGERDDLDFSVNILVLGKSGVGKSATINSIFGEEKAPIDAFETGTVSVKEISGAVDGVKVRVFDTPGLKSSLMEQGFNRSILSSVKKFTKKSPADVILYVDRLDAQTRDLNDLPLLRTVTSVFGSSIWRSAIVTLTHAASAPPDGPSGAPLGYEVFVSQRSHVIQQSIGHAMGDRIISPSLMSPVSLVENHPSCRKNREGQKILPNGQSWRPQLLLLCYSMKILSEASSLSKPADPFDHRKLFDPFDHRKLFGFRARSPPLPYMLSSMLQSRPHPKLPSEQGGDSVDSDIDLDDLSDSDQEEEDEYDQLPPFKPLRKAQIERLTREQKKAYFEEYDYRVKLLQKKQWKEELRRMREIKKKGKAAAPEYGMAEEEADSGAAAPVAVPLPDMALPPSFDGDNPAYRYRFLEPTSQFLARPVLDTHGWDHDCGYDGVNLEHNLAIASRFPLSYTIQITKDKKDFTISLDSSVSAKHGEHSSTLAGFDIQSMGKQLAYIIRAETKSKILKKNKAAGGISFTFLGENTVPGVKIEDRIELGKQYVLLGSAGAVRSQQDTAYGANFELQRRELDYPIGQVQSTLSMSIIKWRGDLALGFNGLAQFVIGRNSKVAVRAGINNKLSGQVTVKTSSSEHLSLALAAVIPTALSIYRKLWPGAAEKYSIY
ncbi:Small monomeric GTPase [Handroanthus impetiginosus]|uniref:Small monomeric GTPase n=1 Tax=Handroanthus impetiginosus TaxID=429701 RepID=A0A2G9GN91_9LAMI|nr:Small monomeric GTPase [Handroanthus impetiginosus]